MEGASISNGFDNMAARKKDAHGKDPMFGHLHRDSKLSIQEQRRSLPIQRLRNELLQAVNENQVTVVIGRRDRVWEDDTDGTRAKERSDALNLGELLRRRLHRE